MSGAEILTLLKRVSIHWLLYAAGITLAAWTLYRFPDPPDGPYKHEVELAVHVANYILLSATLLVLLRRLMLTQIILLDEKHKRIALDHIADFQENQLTKAPQNPKDDFTKQITHTALKIIAENPTRLLGSWEQQFPDSTTAQRSDADSPR